MSELGRVDESGADEWRVRELHRRDKRRAAMFFVITWLALPVAFICLHEVHGMAYQVLRVVILAYIAVFLWSIVRVIQRR
ncbi:hypothetical protein [Gordonia sp. CPCC 205333]|uniref:hypothetical protein n=1 Tax=Gordonia sp. CPCC 205333 TaxID=3140790 RepID=UPI003AF39D8B